MRRAALTAVMTAVTTATACGIPRPSQSSTTGAETGDVTDDAAPSEVPDLGAGDPLCEAEIAALAPQVTQPGGGCSVVMRLDHETLDPIAFRSFCAPYEDTWIDEADARALTECCGSDGTLLSPPDEQQLWVFHAMPSDDLGRVAVVSSDAARRLLEATIAWGEGTGEIVFPADDAWLDPSALGSGCGAVPMPELRSHDLAAGGAITDDRLEDIWSVVGSTALPLAMSTVGQPKRALVLGYPRTMGPFDASTAEVVVVLEGGIPRNPPPNHGACP